MLDQSVDSFLEQVLSHCFYERVHTPVSDQGEVDSSPLLLVATPAEVLSSLDLVNWSADSKVLFEQSDVKGLGKVADIKCFIFFLRGEDLALFTLSFVWLEVKKVEFVFASGKLQNFIVHIINGVFRAAGRYRRTSEEGREEAKFEQHCNFHSSSQAVKLKRVYRISCLIRNSCLQLSLSLLRP